MKRDKTEPGNKPLQDGHCRGAVDEPLGAAWAHFLEEMVLEG